MIGAFITVLGVCAIVAIYMAIVHSFLRSAEEPEDLAREKHLREARMHDVTSHEASSRPHWAH